MGGTSSRLTSAQPQLWEAAGAAPLYATPRNPALYSSGPQVEVVARTLGTPLIPWQQHVSTVANERRPDGSYEYQVIVVSVPRQCGKTTLLRANGVHRCLCGRDVFYTAQTGKDARARWMDLVKVLRVNEALRDRVTIRLRGGSEQVEFPGGAVFQAFAPTPESLHGYTPPTVLVDEGFAQTAMSGELLMGAIGPAQITVTDKQIWIVSTAGTAESVWFHDWIDLAMEGTPRVAGFIWGARDDQDPYDPADIAAFHPGVGFPLNGRVLEASDVLEQAARNTRAEYERAYANRRTATAALLIPADVWRERTGPDFGPPADPRSTVLAYDVAHDRQSATILAAWAVGDVVRVKVVRAEPGTRWLAPAVQELREQWRPRDVVAAPSGPAMETTELLDGVTVFTEREFATASTAFLTAIDDRLIEHDGDPVLHDSVTGLATRSTLDGVALSRRLSVGDSSPGFAAALASHAVRRAPAAVPFIHFGRSSR